MSAMVRVLPALVALAFVSGVAAPRAAFAQDTFRCESRSHQTNYCDVDTRGGIELVRQLSHAGCWEGDTWGYDQRGVWVANGCRAEFAYGRGHWDSRYRYDDRYDDRRDDRDHDNRNAAVAGAVVLGLIGAAVIANNRNDDRDDDRYGYGGSVTCESNDGRRRYCPANVGRGRVEIERKLSRADCRYGQSWGADRGGVWVDNGCRARFSID